MKCYFSTHVEPGALALLMEWEPQKDKGHRKTLTRVGIEQQRCSNPKVLGSIHTLVRVFPFPYVGPITTANAHLVDMGGKLAHITLIVKSVSYGLGTEISLPPCLIGGRHWVGDRLVSDTLLTV